MSTANNVPGGANAGEQPKPGGLIKQFLEGEQIKKRFEEILGKRAPAFIMSVLQVVNSSHDLQNADLQSIYNAAATAAVLDLPLNNNLQFAAIVPFKDNKRKGMAFAQFQMMWRGFVQLAQRSGKFKTINVTDVREGELKLRDRLSGDCTFEWVQNDAERNKLPIIGHVAYFKLSNGFEKVLYKTVDELRGHAKKYSKTYDNENGKWNTDFEAMCNKTVIKELLNKWAPLSVDMSMAIQADQAVMVENGKYEYPDNPVQDGTYEDLTHEGKAEAAMRATEEALKSAGGK